MRHYSMWILCVCVRSHIQTRQFKVLHFFNAKKEEKSLMFDEEDEKKHHAEI